MPALVNRKRKIKEKSMDRPVSQFMAQQVHPHAAASAVSRCGHARSSFVVGGLPLPDPRLGRWISTTRTGSATGKVDPRGGSWIRAVTGRTIIVASSTHCAAGRGDEAGPP